MLASYRPHYGGPEILSIKELPKPHPADDELLIRVHVSTVNRTDCGVLWGAPFIFRFFVGFPKARHVSTGTDFAGVVEAVGKNVTRFKPGDRLFGFNDHGAATHAAYVVQKETAALALMPDDCSFEDAAASAEGAHYAWNYIRKANMQAGDDVLVYGASGAIGSAAVQILKNHTGANVTAVCNGKTIERIRSLGIDKVINYETEDFTATKQRYNHILDAVGKSSFAVCKQLLKEKGKYMSSELGPGNENLYLPFTTMFTSKQMIFPIPTDIRGTLALMQQLLAAKKFKPLIDRSYQLDQLAEAFTYVNSGQKTGNVLIIMP
ncbi:NADPH:quinone reductase-like Zn-dependent oxidoreductase [Lacibacter cauensis]|uniref:NADPH:quinone reductase-like Zn-dependent oxidoreductase n=1 Tax=Lacibacter cauensis TaxID=510947 RepID=A0A562SDM7_9BACT|nr:NAD(P)-dependent alcohol dehydrogenase [Lacibacter cauensis]TWI79391.1 NADPH:quinone reductase-like Zn-dependent oxidoreductase [Lacibacter cauensis]